MYKNSAHLALSLVKLLKSPRTLWVRNLWAPYFHFTGELVKSVLFHQAVDFVWSNRLSAFFQLLVVGKTARQAVEFYLAVIENDIDIEKAALSRTFSVAHRVRTKPITTDAVD